MKFVFYSPHTDLWFRNPAKGILRNRIYPNKYGQLLDSFLQSNHDIYFSAKLSAPSGFFGLLLSLADCADLLLWCIVNKISLRRVGFVFSRKALARKDALFVMHYGNLTHESETRARHAEVFAEFLSSLDIYKIVHLTHYLYWPSIGAHNLANSKPDLLVAENNLERNSAFFRRHFDKIRCEFYGLPYSPKTKFINRTAFAERKNKLVVTGSITYKLRDPQFISFFGTDELQPLRRKLFEKASHYADQMDCLVSDLNATRQAAMPLGPVDRIKERLAAYFGKMNQKDYYKQDIVKIYNGYTMFAVPEEKCDLPAIGFVEGMACGAAYIGLDDPMYRDIGMVPGVHYVAYDGSVEDLMHKVDKYQRNRAELEKIAAAGQRLVSQHLASSVIYPKFIAKIAQSIQSK